jgi:hypothetical protein
MEARTPSVIPAGRMPRAGYVGLLRNVDMDTEGENALAGHSCHRAGLDKRLFSPRITYWDLAD